MPSVSVVALTTPSGEPVSWVAMVVVALGTIGLMAGALLRARRRV